jgi:hypothetical protein
LRMWLLFCRSSLSTVSCNDYRIRPPQHRFLQNIVIS